MPKLACREGGAVPPPRDVSHAKGTGIGTAAADAVADADTVFPQFDP